VTLVDTVGVVSFLRGFPLTPTPLPEGRGAFGAVAWGVLVMSRHWEQRWRACLVVSLAVVWRCGWVMRLLGSQRGLAVACSCRGLFLGSASPIVRVLVRCSGEFVRGCATYSSGDRLGGLGNCPALRRKGLRAILTA